MTQAKAKLNVAMIGSGFMGKAHSNAFCQVNHFFNTPFEICRKVICARDRAKLQSMASRWGWEELETDWRNVVSRPDIDMVDIAVPNVLHAPIAIAAAEAGKTILCEKPLATSLDEAETMVKCARAVATMVWFNYRRVPAVALAKRLIEEKRIGHPYHYRTVYLNQSGIDPTKATTWRYSRSTAGSGATGDLLSHAIDMALYLNSPVEEIIAETHTFAAGRDVDDAVLLLAKFANGSLGTFEATRYALGSRNRLAFEMSGSDGMLHFNLEDLNRLEFFDSQDTGNRQGLRCLNVPVPGHPYADTFWKPGHAIGYEHTFIAALGDFLTALAASQPFHPNFEDALQVERVLDAVARSAASRTWQKICI
jgi:predicted dehydrogenase